jgi:hypothetical protein
MRLHDSEASTDWQMISLLSHGDEEQEQWVFAHRGCMKQATGTDSGFTGLGSEHSSVRIRTTQIFIEGHHSNRRGSGAQGFTRPCRQQEWQQCAGTKRNGMGLYETKRLYLINRGLHLPLH